MPTSILPSSALLQWHTTPDEECKRRTVEATETRATTLPAFRIHTNSKRMQIAPSTIMRVDRITDDAECSQPRLLQGQRELFGHCPAVSSCLLVADEWWPVNCGDGRRTPGSFPVNGQAGAGAAHQPTDRGMRACVRARPPRERESPRHRRGTRPVCPTGRWEMANTASARRRIPVLW